MTHICLVGFHVDSSSIEGVMGYGTYGPKLTSCIYVCRDMVAFINKHDFLLCRVLVVCQLAWHCWSIWLPSSHSHACFHDHLPIWPIALATPSILIGCHGPALPFSVYMRMVLDHNPLHLQWMENLYNPGEHDPYLSCGILCRFFIHRRCIVMAAFINEHNFLLCRVPMVWHDPLKMEWVKVQNYPHVFLSVDI